MTLTSPSGPIFKTTTVVCDAERAFQLWTENVNAWWPAGHTRSGRSDSEIRFEPRPGGRFYETAPDGTELDWGEVVRWQPPKQLAYTWYLGSSAQQPTLVEVEFKPLAEGGTRVDVRHSGPERIGELWPVRSPSYFKAWDVVLPAFQEWVMKAEVEDGV